MAQTHARGRRWEKFARFVVQQYGGICHLCKCGGARQVDHLIPVTEGGDEWDIANCRAAHGAPGNPCLVCSAKAGQKIFCNQIRGGLSIARAQRIIAERISAGNPPGTGNARLPGRPEPDTGAGRSWLAAARDARVVVEPDGQREEGREEDDGRDRKSVV